MSTQSLPRRDNCSVIARDLYEPSDIYPPLSAVIAIESVHDDNEARESFLLDNYI